jgi:phage-related protein
MIYLETLEGKQYDLSQYGLRPLKLEIDSLSPRNEIELIEGQHGHIVIETTYDARTMRVSFLLEANDRFEFPQLRNEIYKLFDGKTYFYLIEIRLPDRQWKVRSVTKFIPDKANARTATFTIELVSASPFSESINPVEYKYTQNFSFNNIGDESIDLRTQNETEIEFKGGSDGLSIHNKTTGDIWSYHGSTTAADVVLLKGIRSTKNGASIFGQTNKKILTFAPGWNDFEILGSTDFNLTIRTRFYFI